MNLQITTDKFHEENHTACSKAFLSSKYTTLANTNTKACEQTNSELRGVGSSTKYINPQLFIKAVNIFWDSKT